MSRDFRPIDHILTNIYLEKEGKISRYMMETPYLEIHMSDGTVVPLTDKECAEKYPYATYFTDIGSRFQENKGDKGFTESLEKLEEDLHRIVSGVEFAYGVALSAGKGEIRLDLERTFDRMSKDLRDYVLAEGDYSYDYDGSEARKLFTDRFVSRAMNKDIYYGVVQASHGHDYVYLFKENQIPEEVKGLLPSEPGETNTVDIYWPMGGSNSSASYIEVLQGEDRAVGFLMQEAFGPDLEDPMLIDLAEYMWTIETGEGCAAEILDRYGLSAEDFSQSDKRVEEILDRYGLSHNDLYRDDLRDIRYSESYTDIPAALIERRDAEFVQMAKEAFELETWFIGSLSGGIDPPRDIHSAEQNEDGSVTVKYSMPATCGLSDCRYHNPDTDVHTAVYTLNGDRLLLEGGDVFPSLAGWNDPDYAQKASKFFKSWGLEVPEDIARAAKEDVAEDIER